MRKAKNYLYVFTLGLAIIFFFFKAYFPLKVVFAISIIPTILMIIALILELLTRSKKNER